MKFITHFMRRKKSKKYFTRLASVKQRVGETLTEFLARWRAKEAEVDDIDNKSAIIMFIETLRAKDLCKSL